MVHFDFFQTLFRQSTNLEEIDIENCPLAEPVFTESLLGLEKLRIFRYRGCYGSLLHYSNRNLTLIGRLRFLQHLL